MAGWSIGKLSVWTFLITCEYPDTMEKDDIAVYRVNEGKIISLMATDNDTGEYVSNALDMSDTMERIFEE